MHQEAVVCALHVSEMAKTQGDQEHEHFLQRSAVVLAATCFAQL